MPSGRAALSEKVRDSLFLVPTAFAVGGIALAIVALVADEALSSDAELPLGVASTPESARSVLSTVASATMTFAGIAFSVTLLVFQMSSSQYSPRVIHGLFRDGFNKRIIGVVVGIFTYCLVVLRSVHGPVDGGPDATVPTLSVSIAVVLGVVAVLAIVGFIDHNAHRMDVSHILQGVTDQTRQHAADRWWPDDDRTARSASAPTGGSTTVTADADGWVQQLDLARLLASLPAGTTMVMDAAPGRYAARGAPLCRLSPPPDDLHGESAGGDAPARTAEIRRAIVIGPARTLTQDPGYGLRQMVDVALKALSPGINDPTTAQDAIFHIADALRELLVADPPPAEVRGDDGRRVLLRTRSRTELVDLAFDELRRAAGPHPAVTTYLLAAIETVALCAGDTPEGPAVRAALRRQAGLAVAESEHAGVPEWELVTLRQRLARLDLG